MRAPDGSIALDPTGRAPGRGAYLCRDATCLDTAARRRSIEHALGASLPFDVRTLVDPRQPSTQPVDAEATSTPESMINEGGARGQE